jgi:alpha-L-rhamnosidase
MVSCTPSFVARFSRLEIGLVIALAAGLALPMSAAAAGGRLAAIDLRCDAAVDPLGVDSAPPRLSWRLQGEGRGLNQTAWQVLVASSRAALDAGRGDVWDSGRVRSDDQACVVAARRPLRTAEQMFWKVRVWDGDGRASAWSAPATWTMGQLDPAGWSARWIAHPDWLKWVRPHLGYHSEETRDPNTTKWIQLDLGVPRPIETLRFRALQHTVQEMTGFPRRFKIEAANDPEFRQATVITDQTAQDFANPWISLYTFPVNGVTARYVRLTAPVLRVSSGVACLAFSQIEVISGGRNVAPGAVVTASDSWESGPWSAAAVVDRLGIPGVNPFANSTLRLRREFVVCTGLRRAVAFVCGLGQYELSLNGARVDAGLLSPGWTNYAKTCLYDTLDLTARLQSGANALGLTLAGGMYNVQDSGGRYLKFVTPFRPLTAIAQIRLEYADGTVETIDTDERWRGAPGPVTFADMFGGEDYDARLEPRGWDRPGFDDAAWAAAVPGPGPGGVLRGFSHAAPALGTFEVLKPVGRRDLRPGVEVYDLGQNTALVLRLAVRGPAGSIVRVIPAELTREDGSVDRGSCGGPAWWQYTLCGGTGLQTREPGNMGQETHATEDWAPTFFYHGARYLQVERTAPEGGGEVPVVESIEGFVFHSTAAPAGDFACSNGLFNRIRTLVRWAQLSNSVSVFTDCPHRERLGWIEQYHLNGPALRYESDLARLFIKGFGDMADAQLANGLVPDIAPEYVTFAEGFRDSPEWGSALILAAWQQYVWTGDDTVLRRYYDAMRRYLDYLASRATGHLLNHGLGDWYDLGPNRPGFAQLTPVAVTATAIYFEDARALATIARQIGRTADAAAYEKLAGDIRTAFNQAFFDPNKGVYATGSQTANAMAYVLDLVEPACAAGVLNAIVADVEQRGNAPTAGDVGFRYLLRALAKGGRSDVIFRMNNQSERPGYGYQLARGATSLTEAWNADRRSSQNHFMLGQITEWFYHDLAGLAPDPAAPGFKHVIIHPQPVGDISWVRASHESPRGRIAVAWRRENNRFLLDVELPPNTTATVWIPAAAAETVTEGGRPAGRSPGVRFLRLADQCAVFAVDSGHYAFAATSPAAPSTGR